MEEFKIESLPPAAAGDNSAISALSDLVNKVYETAEAGLWECGVRRTSTAAMAEFARSGELAVAIREGRLVGCVRIHRRDEKVGEFSMLAADPACRGIGIGRELVKFAEQQAHAWGCTIMQLEVLVPSGWKHPSKEFLDQWYTRIGYVFTRMGELAELYPELSRVLATPCEFRIYHKDIALMR